jgi:hypothetical protein
MQWQSISITLGAGSRLPLGELNAAKGVALTAKPPPLPRERGGDDGFCG